MLTRGHVVIDTEACKGCDLCIDACPPKVLVMTTHTVNARGYRYPLLAPGCTGCKACSQICPDFVFQVYKLATPITVDLDDLDDFDEIGADGAATNTGASDGAATNTGASDGAATNTGASR